MYRSLRQARLPTSGKADLDSMFAMIGMEQYRYSRGLNDTIVVGTLQGYSAMPILPTIKVPVLSS